MAPPDMIPEGTSVPEFLLRLRSALAVEGSDPDGSEFDVKVDGHGPASGLN